MLNTCPSLVVMLPAPAAVMSKVLPAAPENEKKSVCPWFEIMPDA
jgi:hypothetical protein